MSKTNNEDYIFIKNFNKIKIKNICEKLQIDRSNVLKGKASDEKLFAVRREIEKEYASLYLKEKIENE